jgi:hypothetical protein
LIEERDGAPAPSVRQETFEQDVAQVQEWQADLAQRIRERAGAVLDPAQCARLEDYYALQTSMSSMRLARVSAPSDRDESD